MGVEGFALGSCVVCTEALMGTGSGKGLLALACSKDLGFGATWGLSGPHLRSIMRLAISSASAVRLPRRGTGGRALADGEGRDGGEAEEDVSRAETAWRPLSLPPTRSRMEPLPLSTDGVLLLHRPVPASGGGGRREWGNPQAYWCQQHQQPRSEACRKNEPAENEQGVNRYNCQAPWHGWRHACHLRIIP